MGGHDINKYIVVTIPTVKPSMVIMGMWDEPNFIKKGVIRGVVVYIL